MREIYFKECDEAAIFFDNMLIAYMESGIPAAIAIHTYYWAFEIWSVWSIIFNGISPDFPPAEEIRKKGCLL